MGMVSIYLPEVRFCHCEERNDEAIPQASGDCFAPLAMTVGDSQSRP